MNTYRPPFTRITIVGVGLIGGSFGLAVKQRFPSIEILGIDKPPVLIRAKRRRAIDKAVRSLEGAVSQSDLIVLAAPPSAIMKLLPQVARYAVDSTIVTDVGGVKSEIGRLGQKLFPARNFIGGHPMAGAEISGIVGAHPLLFENALWVLTPIHTTNKENLRKLSGFLKHLGARVLLMESSVHDAVASAVSHLPQLAAVAMMNVAGRRHVLARNYLKLAAGGFRDMTRIASSPYELWTDILTLNKTNIQTSLRLFTKELQAYSSSLGQTKLSSAFRASKRLRNSIPKGMKGFLHPLVDVFVFVKDHPGTLARLTSALAGAGINISDLELVKVREGSGGTFRISFGTEELAARAQAILRKAGFQISQ